MTYGTIAVAAWHGAKVHYARVELIRDNGCLRLEEFSMRKILSELGERQRRFLLMLTDFGIAVCSAKLIVHLIILSTFQLPREVFVKA
jgi:hypothetical protein